MRIRIVSPAGHTDPDIIDSGAETLRSWGHDVSLAAHAKGAWGRYSGTPAERIEDIADALADPSVDVLWCARGGYGAMQLLDRIAPTLIAHAGKPIIGYSDVTALHALWQKAGVPSIHGPMMRHLAEEPQHPASLALRALLSRWPAAQGSTLPLQPHPLNLLPDEHPTAPVVGGNLAVLSALHGTPYDFDYRGRILFVEDIGESPYKIDRMMQTLRLAGILDQIAGLIVGHFTGTHLDEDVQPGTHGPKALLESLHDMLLPYRIAVRFDAPIGHTACNWPVVEGRPLTL